MANQSEVTIELKKSDMKFSAGHFTIFSATHRERMHGHNYQVTAKFSTAENQNGLSFDYNIYKEKIVKLCESLNEFFLLPGKSPFLILKEQGEYIDAIFNNERIPFLKKDVCILPISNITVEELSKWFLSCLTTQRDELKKNSVSKVSVCVFASLYQSATVEWSSNNKGA